MTLQAVSNRSAGKRDYPMKRLIALLLSLILTGMTVPLRETTAGPIAISNREGLRKIAEHPDGDYVLTADIDLSEEPWTPIPFCGTLDGAGHTIGNLTVRETGEEARETFDGNRKRYDTVFAGLFSVAEGASIRNLRILNAELDIETDQNCFLGAIAGYAKDTVIENCTVSMRGTLTVSSVNVGLGGMVGFWEESEASGCSVEAELLFLDGNPDVLCEEFLGGVYASGYGTIRDCTVYTRGFAEIYGYAHNGGVGGMFKLPHGYKKPHFSIRDTAVDAEIRFFEVTPSRRAYCKPIIGEDGAKDCYLTHNTELHFAYEEFRTPVRLRPESCETPMYTYENTPSTCTEWGYTTFTCSTCGYTYRDFYTLPQHRYRITETPPNCTQDGLLQYLCVDCGEAFTEPIPSEGHTPGEWTVKTVPEIGKEGTEERTCVRCGTVLDTRVISALMPILAESISLSTASMDLTVGDTATLAASVLPSDATNSGVGFASSSPDVASVDQNGVVTANRAGTATLTVSSADGNAYAYCMVTVTEPADEPVWRLPEPFHVQERESDGTFFLFRWLRCN